MKKLIAIFIAVLLMSFCLSFTVSAKEADFTIADDFQSLTYQGVTYLRADTSMVTMEYFDDWDEKPQLTAKQQELLRDSSFSLDSSKKIVEATFYYRDGTIVYCGFVAEDFYEQYNDYLTSDDTECYIWFYWDEFQRTTVLERDLKGTAVTLNERSLMQAEEFPVYVNSGLWGFTMTKGSLLMIQDTFYYASHREIDHYSGYTIDLYDLESLDCYQVTDPAVVATLEDAMGDYYDLTYGSENLLGLVSFSFWTFIFAIVPAGICVLALIFFIRGKGYHRYTWGATAMFAVLSFIMYFVVIVPSILYYDCIVSA